MILFEFLGHLLNFDLVWLFSFVYANLLFVFMMSVLIFLFWEGKHFFEVFFVFVILIWAWDAFGITSGIMIWGSAFLYLNYMSKVSVIKFAEETPSMKRIMIPIQSTVFYAMIVLFALFWM